MSKTRGEEWTTLLQTCPPETYPRELLSWRRLLSLTASLIGLWQSLETSCLLWRSPRLLCVSLWVQSPSEGPMSRTVPLSEPVLMTVFLPYGWYRTLHLNCLSVSKSQSLFLPCKRTGLHSKRPATPDSWYEGCSPPGSRPLQSEFLDRLLPSLRGRHLCTELDLVGEISQVSHCEMQGAGTASAALIWQPVEEISGDLNPPSLLLCFSWLTGHDSVVELAIRLEYKS